MQTIIGVLDIQITSCSNRECKQSWPYSATDVIAKTTIPARLPLLFMTLQNPAF
jgi:hypothetical protein